MICGYRGGLAGIVRRNCRYKEKNCGFSKPISIWGYLRDVEMSKCRMMAGS